MQVTPRFSPLSRPGGLASQDVPMDRAGPMSQDRPPAHSHWAPSSHDSDPVLGIFVHLVSAWHGEGREYTLGAV